MSDDYDRIRALLLGDEQTRLAQIESALQRTDNRFANLSETLAVSIERANLTRGASRLAQALSESTTESLELAVRKRPDTVVQAMFPVIGPAIRRSLSEALRGMAHDMDQALHDTFSFKALRWRLEAWRTGTPYAHVALRHQLQYQVEHLFLIQADSGLLLEHITTLKVADIDADAVAGMLTAIGQFVNDSMSTDASNWLDRATIGEYCLLISHGPLASVAAFVRGVPPSDLGERLDELNEAVHAHHGHVLCESLEHNTERGSLLQAKALADLNQLRQSEGQWGDTRRNTLFVIALGVGLAITCVTWWWLDNKRSSEILAIRNELTSIPGFVLLQIESDDKGALRIYGLHDPDALNPRPLIANNHPDIRVQWRLHPFVSAEPKIIMRRAKEQLALPEEVKIRLDPNRVLHLVGVVPFASWYSARRASPMIPGVKRIESNALEYPGKASVDMLVQTIEASHIDFSDGTELSPAGAAQLTQLLAAVDALQIQAQRAEIFLYVSVFGYTDEPGSLAMNRELRLRRSEWLSEKIRPRLRDRSDVDVDMQTLSAWPFHGKHRAAGVRVRIESVAIRE